ncbi:MAG: Fe-S cluster assembly protein NifU [Syntrophobacterales bacterium]|jgi:NifU-like protein|nr:Fe-S cluster assembly protein NifU [Syntrophobacterales bacterium]
MWEYTDKVREYFLNPRNVGEIENPDGIADVGSIACGDALKLTFKLDENKRIIDAKFKTFGCASAIASASALTEMVKGMTIEEAGKITNQDIAEYLGGLPPEKMHCSVLGQEALEKAIDNYRGSASPKKEGEIICECFGVTDKEIKQAISENHLTTVEEITNYTKAGGGCQNCHGKIQAIIDSIYTQTKPEIPATEKSRLTNIQKIRLIEETIDKEIRPSLKHDGGDIELVDIVGNRVLVATRGACAVCQASQLTLKGFVEIKLRELVSPELVVEEVSP